MDKQLPQSIEAEQGVLGSLIIDPEVLPLVSDHVQPEDFYRDAHRTIYQVMLHLDRQHQPADFLTICDELERLHRLEEVGGPGYITSLVNLVPTSGNVAHYARIVERTAILRRLIHAAGQIAAMAYDETDAEVALEHAEQLIFSLGRASTPDALVPIGDILTACMEDLDTLHQRRGTLIGLSTGFRSLDIPLGGLQRSDLLIVAARPGTGKTSFALNVAVNAAQAGHHVAFFSLEMSRQQLGVRLLSLLSRVDQHRLRSGWVHDEEWERLVQVLDSLTGGELWIDDTGALPISTLRSRARRLQAEHGLDLLMVDYLQLAQATLEGKRSANREQEIAEISRSLKALAKELNVPVLALAQLSRAVESRQSKIPQLSDLRESGAIENDADVVLFIYRDELYNPETQAPKTADLIIAKHRNGPTGTIRLGFEASQTRFHELAASAGEEE